MFSFFNRLISLSFYTLFLLVPIVFTSNTSELFEMNKMWLTWGLTIIIGASWFGKMILEKRFFVRRTVLDIPIALFLVSQIISTIFSLDSRVSWWGYYSRFNGGLLSLITYAFLFYAFVSHADKKFVMRCLKVSLVSGLIVALWGFPSHFGYDPTCFLFRGTLDVSCWTNAFQPKVRIFSTLGQPDWLAAYLVVLIPISLAFGLNSLKTLSNKEKKYNVFSIKYFANKEFLQTTFYILLATLFYLDLLFTKAKSGLIGFGVSFVVLLVGYIFYSSRERSEARSKNRTIKTFLVNNLSIIITTTALLLLTFLAGNGFFAQLDKFTLSGFQQHFATINHTVSSSRTATPSAQQSNPVTGEFGGTDSGKIRLLVWHGAIDAWLHHPIFGTGVETFAFAYYLYRPSAHNLTSEWEYLYNKAHNEYLNYLATTGAFGLLTYLAMIGVFLYVTAKKMLSSKEKTPDELISLALFASYISILVTNFFGFSVVTQNIYLFLIPGFALILGDYGLGYEFSFPKKLETKKGQISSLLYPMSPFQWVGIIVVIFIALYLIFLLLKDWTADISYALGNNMDKAGAYQQAVDPLHTAVNSWPEEPTFQDELSLNDSAMAIAYAQQKDTANAQKFAQEAFTVSNAVITSHPNVVTFWKTRVRVLYTLSQLNPQFLQMALDAALKAQSLAPTDAKIAYNVALLYDQMNQVQKAVDAGKKAVSLKPDYRDAYYALGIFYRQLATDKNGKTIINADAEQQAVYYMKYILTHFSPQDQAADVLKTWGEQ